MKLDKELLWIIFGYVLVSFFLTTGLYWDAGVYIGMGKYLWSFGEIGFFEASRPVLWPLLIGWFWKLGMNVMFMSKLAGVVLGSGCIFLTYKISKELFSTGKVAAFFLAASPVFLFSAEQRLSSLLSVFFGLMGVYLFLKKKNRFAGMFLGLAFLSRFLQGMLLLVIIVSLLFDKQKKRALEICICAGIIVLPYLVLNFMLYQNPFYPFYLQWFLSSNTGWLWHESWWFYLRELIASNYLLFFLVPGILFTRKNKKAFLISSLFLCLFLFYSLVPQKEPRFMLSFLPFFAIMCGIGYYQASSGVRKTLFLIPLAALLLQSGFSLTMLPQINSLPLDAENLSSEIVGISNPLYIVNSNQKAELLYYPLFTKEKAEEIKELDMPLVVSSCDLLCRPDDILCEDAKKELFEFFETKEIVERKELNDCVYTIFS